MARYSRQAGWNRVALLDIAADDTFIASNAAGHSDAGHAVTVLTELTYVTGAGAGGSALAAASARFPSATVVGGLWMKYWTPTNLTTEMIAMGTNGYWLFTPYSMYIGQTAQDALATSSDYTLNLNGTPGSSVTQYWAAIAAGNA